MNSLIISDNRRLQRRDGGTITLAGILRQVENLAEVKYLRKGDEYREQQAIPRSPRWTYTTPALAAQVYEVHNSSPL